jgi:hypothetical protein
MTDDIKSSIHKDIVSYNDTLHPKEAKICNLLADIITRHLAGATNKLWHAHPVWFLDGNPIVGYSRQKRGIRLMFWSGSDFSEALLEPGTGKFKDASIFYTDSVEVNADDLVRWLEKGTDIQWDYKNIVKRKGKLLPVGYKGG